MKRHPGERGNAMLTATIVVVMTTGIGGAFLAETVFSGKSQFRAMQKDEAQVVCDAAIEKVRRALWKYKYDETWNWDNILAYCLAMDTNPATVKTAWTTDKETAAYKAFLTQLTSGTYTSPAYEAPLPADPVSPNADDPIFIGWNRPFGDVGQYAFQVVVRNNDDSGILDFDGIPGSPTHDSDRKVFLIVTATLPDGTQRQIEALVYDPTIPTNFDALAAVVAHDNVELLGNITIDGRDWSFDNMKVDAAGVFGILSKSTIADKGSSAVGGRGIAPPFPSGVPAGTVYEDYEKELPNDPDKALNVDLGTLRAIAISKGTYFPTAVQYEAWLAANGGSNPGRAVVYVEETIGPMAQLGKVMNAKPSILIVHNSTGSTVMNVLHGEFKGLILCDSINKVNSNAAILGAIYCFSPSAPDTFGNGTADIRFSSKVLSQLPALSSAGLEVLSYRRIY